MTSASAAALTLSRAVADIEFNMGIELPLRSSADSGRWRTTFVGTTWHTAFGASVDIALKRATDLSSGAVDRSVTVCMSRAARGGEGLMAVWITRNFDAPAIPLRATVGLDVPF